MSELPFVSVIMPVRNEEGYIERAIRSVLTNDYPHDKLEVIVVDGMSDDRTREIVLHIAENDKRVLLVDNKNKTVPYAMNIGLREINGDVFVRLDGHAEMDSGFLNNSMKCLQEHQEAWVAGGYLETIAHGYVGNAIAAAMQSSVGVGNAMFRRGDYEGWVDTLAFGIHHKWILDKIGYFDEELVRNQDDEFNMRVIEGGGRIWLSKSIKSKYYSRSSLKQLWKQYFQYGFWRIRTIQKHGKPATVRQIIPVLFVLSMLCLGGIGFLWTQAWWLLCLELVVYVAGLLYGAVDVYKNNKMNYAILSPVIFVVLHFGYGLGSLWGCVRFLVLRGCGMPKPEQYSMSR